MPYDRYYAMVRHAISPHAASPFVKRSGSSPDRNRGGLKRASRLVIITMWLGPISMRPAGCCLCRWAMTGCNANAGKLPVGAIAYTMRAILATLSDVSGRDSCGSTAQTFSNGARSWLLIREEMLWKRGPGAHCMALRLPTPRA